MVEKSDGFKLRGRTSAVGGVQAKGEKIGLVPCNRELWSKASCA